MKKYSLLMLLVVSLCLAQSCIAATYTVTNVFLAGAGSLAEALNQANSNAGLDTIEFDIPGRAPFTIRQEGLTITDSVIIDGYTQPGAVRSSTDANQPWNGVLQIILRASPGSTLVISAPNVEIRGLRFLAGDSAFRIDGTSGGDQRIYGCVFGRTAEGTFSGGLGNAIRITGDGNQIGGVEPWQRNVVVGQIRLEGNSNIVRGNLVGLAEDGDTTHPNLDTMPGRIEIIGNNNVIGGTVVGARNVSAWTVFIQGERNIVRRNYIGTDVTGTQNRSQGLVGIWIDSGDGNIIGARNAGRNFIAGSSITGIYVRETATNTVIQRNRIGVGVGMVPIGLGGVGVEVAGSGTQIGGSQANDGNVIAHGDRGVIVHGTAQGVTIRGNSIFGHAYDGSSSSGIGIDLLPGLGPTLNDVGDLDSGANGLLNYPIVTDIEFLGSDVQVSAAYEGTVGESYDLEFFVNPGPDDTGYGEGESLVHVENAVIPPGGTYQTTFVIPAPGASPGNGIAATATDAGGSTSEFSASLEVLQENRVVNLNDTGYGSLRRALEHANLDANPDTVVVELTGTIALQTALPPIIHPLRLEGGPGAGTTVDGSALVSGTHGIVVNADGCSFIGLGLINFDGASGFRLEADDVTIASCAAHFSDIGIDQVQGKAEVYHSSFIGNGVGIWLRGDGGSLERVSAFSGDTGLIVEADSVRVHHSIFDNNTSHGMWVRTTVEGMVVTSSTFFANQGSGVLLQGSGCVIGDADDVTVVGGSSSLGNLMASNALDGITVEGTDNLIRPLATFSNGGQGIDLNEDGPTPNDPLDLDSGPNELLNFPILTLVEHFGPGCPVRVSGEYHGKPNTQFTIDIYSNGNACDPSGFGESDKLVATFTVETDENGDATFQECTRANASVGAQFVAHASDSSNSSELGPCLVSEVSTAAPETGLAPVLTQLHPITPNPAWETSTIRFELAASSVVEVSVFDVRGRHVRTLEQDRLEASTYVTTWDRRTDGGQRVASGVYFVVLRAGEARYSRKILLLE